MTERQVSHKLAAEENPSRATKARELHSFRDEVTGNDRLDCESQMETMMSARSTVTMPQQLPKSSSQNKLHSGKVKSAVSRNSVKGSECIKNSKRAY